MQSNGEIVRLVPKLSAPICAKAVGPESVLAAAKRADLCERECASCFSKDDEWVSRKRAVNLMLRRG